MVTAAGELVHASATENPDLFWRMRGAGANFGVAVSFEFDTHPAAAQVGFAMLLFVPDDIATLANQSMQLAPYAGLLAEPPEMHGRGEPHAHSGLVPHLDAEVADGLAELLSSNGQFILSIRSAGGAVTQTPADATAYAWCDANFFIATLGGSANFERRWTRLLPLFEGMYLSFETDTGPDTLARAFPPAHLERLRALKQRWDPDGLFRDNFYINPTERPPHRRPR